MSRRTVQPTFNSHAKSSDDGDGSSLIRHISLRGNFKVISSSRPSILWLENMPRTILDVLKHYLTHLIKNILKHARPPTHPPHHVGRLFCAPPLRMLLIQFAALQCRVSEDIPGILRGVCVSISSEGKFFMVPLYTYTLLNKLDSVHPDRVTFDRGMRMVLQRRR